MDLNHISETTCPLEVSSAAAVGAEGSNTDVPTPGNEEARTSPKDGYGSDNAGSEKSDGEPGGGEPAQRSISKSQLKKLKRRQMWEERRGDRKRLRKEKRHQQQAKRRAAREEKAAELEASGMDPEAALEAARPKPRTRGQQVPVTIILDCDFESYMSDKELVSLSSQIVRAYADNRSGSVQSHLVISSWGGKLRERFETVLGNHHFGWKGVRFTEANFVQAARDALDFMKGPRGGILVESLIPQEGPAEEAAERSATTAVSSSIEKDAQPGAPVPEVESEWKDPSIVYLTADSPYTLERLEPYTSYVVGGIIDRNREKGLCYKRACERAVRTAKLPIGEYMVMASRKVLTTNQVVEIMVRWLEFGDWKVAFQQAIPKRKGGMLKEQKADKAAEEGAEGQDDEEGGVEDADTDDDAADRQQ